MNTIAKLGLAGALCFSYASAHAAFAVASSSSPGDIILFGEVVSNTGQVLGSYAGDTQVAVGSSYADQTLISAASDSNLAAFIALGTTGTNVIKWAVQGGGGLLANPSYGNTGAAIFNTTLAVAGSLTANNTIGGNLNNWALLGTNTQPALNANATAAGHEGANSVFGTTGLASNGIWDGQAAGANNVSNWFSNGTDTAVTGFGSTSLYAVTGGGSVVAPALVNTIGNVILSSTGLSFSNGVAAVPLPAAIWLLGSGLLGLAGVARRKISAVTA